MPGPIANVFDTIVRGIVWIIYGPFSGVIPFLLLYGMFEFGLDFFASRSRRERRLDAAILLTCFLGVLDWLLRSHIPIVLLVLLGASLIATFIAFISAVKAPRRRKQKRLRASHTQEGADTEAAIPEPVQQ
jgi:uncharacterized membrane protein YbhN (UPF0104 family)